MHRITLPLIALAILSSPARSSELQDSLEARWRHAWLLTTAEIYSNCDQDYSENIVNGRLVSGTGAVRFSAGELARVHKIDVERSRIDIYLDIAEPLTRPYHDGPFELYNEIRCQVKLRVKVPREIIKSGDLPAAERYLLEISERYPVSADAHESRTWNGRLRKPLPENYRQTLAKYRKWKVATRITESIAQADRAAASVSLDPAFSSGLTAGIVNIRQVIGTRSCDELLKSALTDYLRKLPLSESRAFSEGFLLGQHLSYHLHIARTLRDCFQ